MAKKTGLGATVSVDDSGGSLRDISNDVGAFQFNTPRGVQDVTGVDKSAFERLLLLSDFQLGLTGVAFNTATNAAHDVFKTTATQAGTITRTVTIVFAGGGTVTAEAMPTDYAISRNQDGSLGWTAQLQLANGTAATWS